MIRGASLKVVLDSTRRGFGRKAGTQRVQDDVMRYVNAITGRRVSTTLLDLYPVKEKADELLQPVEKSLENFNEFIRTSLVRPLD